MLYEPIVMRVGNGTMGVKGADSEGFGGGDIVPGVVEEQYFGGFARQVGNYVPIGLHIGLEQTYFV